MLVDKLSLYIRCKRNVEIKMCPVFVQFFFVSFVQERNQEFFRAGKVS